MSFLFGGHLHLNVPIAYPPSTPLTEVVVQALSSEAYISATTFPSAFQAWLYSLPSVSREGVYETTSSTSTNGLSPFDGISHTQPLRYAIKATAPTLRGLVSCGTKIYVITSECKVDGMDHGSLGSMESGEYEIDESFLESGVLDQRARPEISLASLPALQDLEDDHTMYAHTRELGRLGVLSGDWAIIRPSNNHCCRLVRIRAGESVSRAERALYASPILLRNIIRDAIGTNVNICPTPFGSGAPTIPTARVATIARISSPVAVDKTYQHAFLQKLHEHFHHRPRLMQQGDIIAVALDTDDAHWTTHSDDGRELSVHADGMDAEYLQ
ncbi:hypothetical protein NM688_g9257 [Phlebia brevispora]|uniref:Uncharacterized protein n=1 Tax=Phlebia brevispora TaxID=194682 RepID=A0ACC1RHN7_9APHY|nr:hypothetical protein NM688_g9257 [Phlebia brevispora]